MMDLIYPEVTFTPEWKEGRAYERERIFKLIDNFPDYPNDKGWTSKLKREFRDVILGAKE